MQKLISYKKTKFFENRPNDSIGKPRELWKALKSLGLPKKGTKTNPSNYRAISLLTLISKIIKKVIHEQTISFLCNNEILYNYQSGFWKNRSTDSASRFCMTKF